jgi:putative transposase
MHCVRMVHCLRNLLAHVPQGDKAMVAAAVRTIFAQPNWQAAGQQLQEVAKALEGRWPKAATVLLEVEEDVLAYMAFPQGHWARIYSTNPLERLNREVKRRTDIVGVFPDQESVLRLVGSVLLEIDDEWHIERRYFSQDSMRKLREPSAETLASAGPLRLGPMRQGESHPSSGIQQRPRAKFPDTNMFHRLIFFNARPSGVPLFSCLLPRLLDKGNYLASSVKSPPHPETLSVLILQERTHMEAIVPDMSTVEGKGLSLDANTVDYYNKGRVRQSLRQVYGSVDSFSLAQDVCAAELQLREPPQEYVKVRPRPGFPPPKPAESSSASATAAC